MTTVISESFADSLQKQIAADTERLARLKELGAAFEANKTAFDTKKAVADAANADLETAKTAMDNTYNAISTLLNGKTLTAPEQSAAMKAAATRRANRAAVGTSGMTLPFNVEEFDIDDSVPFWAYFALKLKPGQNAHNIATTIGTIASGRTLPSSVTDPQHIRSTLLHLEKRGYYNEGDDGSWTFGKRQPQMYFSMRKYIGMAMMAADNKPMLSSELSKAVKLLKPPQQITNSNLAVILGHMKENGYVKTTGQRNPGYMWSLTTKGLDCPNWYKPELKFPM